MSSVAVTHAIWSRVVPSSLTHYAHKYVHNISLFLYTLHTLTLDLYTGTDLVIRHSLQRAYSRHSDKMPFVTGCNK